MASSMFTLIGLGSARRSTIPVGGSTATLAAVAAAAGGSSGIPAPGARPRLVSREGWMEKEGEVFKSWHKRYFRLHGTTLAYYDDKDKVKGVIPLTPSTIVRPSLRKASSRNMEHGFELVSNPSAASREGTVALGPSGEHYANTSTAAAAAGVTSDAPPPAEERVYYLCLPESVPPAIALQQRDEWMATIRNNIHFESALRAWAEKRDAEHETMLNDLRKVVEQVRAEREMELFDRESKEHERAAAERARQELTADHQQRREELQKQQEQAIAKAIEADRLTRQASTPTSTPATSDIADQLAALQRKNQALESDVRMIVAENADLKEKAMVEAKKMVAEEAQKRAQELLRIERERFESEKRQLEAQIAQLKQRAEQAAATAAATTAATAAAHATAASATTAASAQPPSTADATEPSVDPAALRSAAPCLCKCVPPCVPFSAHKSTLAVVGQLETTNTQLENRLAAARLEREQLEAQCSRYKAEKKVLKQEVIRLRSLQDETTRTKAPVS